MPNCYASQPYAYEYATPVSAYADWNYTSDAAGLAQYSSKMASHGGGPLLDTNAPASSPLQNVGSSLDYGGYHQSYQTASPYSIDTGKSIKYTSLVCIAFVSSDKFKETTHEMPNSLSMAIYDHRWGWVFVDECLSHQRLLCWIDTNRYANKRPPMCSRRLECIPSFHLRAYQVQCDDRRRHTCDFVFFSCVRLSCVTFFQISTSDTVGWNMSKVQLLSRRQVYFVVLRVDLWIIGKEKFVFLV